MKPSFGEATAQSAQRWVRGSPRPPWVPLFARVLCRVDRVAFRLTGGRRTVSSTYSGLPVIMLTTTGARTGMPRTVPVLGIPIGEDTALRRATSGAPIPGVASICSKSPTRGSWSTANCATWSRRNSRVPRANGPGSWVFRCTRARLPPPRDLVPARSACSFSSHTTSLNRRSRRVHSPKKLKEPLWEPTAARSGART